MIAQGFGFTRDFLKEWNNGAYFRLKKIPCEFKEQARARHPGEKCGLVEDKRYVENGKIITAGGISAGIDMSLYVVEQLLGKEILALTLEEMEWQWHQLKQESMVSVD